VSLDEAVEYLTRGGPRQRYAVITFDDGYLDNYTLALPVLQRYAVPATLFVCTGFIETGYSNWDALDAALLSCQDKVLDLRAYGLGMYPFEGLDQRKEVLARLHGLLKMMPHEAMVKVVGNLGEGMPPGHPRTMMNWQELANFASAPGMTIGAHTLTHPNLTRLPQHVMRGEIQQSKEILSERLGTAVRHFAYPSGLSSELVEREAQGGGFVSACSVEDGFNVPGCNLFSLRRRCIIQDACEGNDGAYSDMMFSFFASGVRQRISKILHSSKVS